MIAHFQSVEFYINYKKMLIFYIYKEKNECISKLRSNIQLVIYFRTEIRKNVNNDI